MQYFSHFNTQKGLSLLLAVWLAAVVKFMNVLNAPNVFINRKENYTIHENRQEIFSSSSVRLISPFFYLSCSKKYNLCSSALLLLHFDFEQNPKIHRNLTPQQRRQNLADLFQEREMKIFKKST